MINCTLKNCDLKLQRLLSAFCHSVRKVSDKAADCGVEKIILVLPSFSQRFLNECLNAEWENCLTVCRADLQCLLTLISAGNTHWQCTTVARSYWRLILEDFSITRKLCKGRQHCPVQGCEFHTWHSGRVWEPLGRIFGHSVSSPRLCTQ